MLLADIRQQSPRPGEHRGGSESYSQEWPNVWIAGSTRFHGTSLVSCVLVAGNQLMPLIGAYFPPSTLEHLPDLGEAPICFPCRDPVVLGGINADIGCLSNPWYQQVAGLLASFELVDLLVHFYSTFATASYRCGSRSAKGRSSDPGATTS